MLDDKRTRVVGVVSCISTVPPDVVADLPPTLVGIPDVGDVSIAVTTIVFINVPLPGSAIVLLASTVILLLDLCVGIIVVTGPVLTVVFIVALVSAPDPSIDVSVVVIPFLVSVGLTITATDNVEFIVAVTSVEFSFVFFFSIGLVVGMDIVSVVISVVDTDFPTGEVNLSGQTVCKIMCTI